MDTETGWQFKGVLLLVVVRRALAEDDSGWGLQLSLVMAGGDGSGDLAAGQQMRVKALEYRAARELIPLKQAGKSCW